MDWALINHLQGCGWIVGVDWLARCRRRFRTRANSGSRVATTDGGGDGTWEKFKTGSRVATTDGGGDGTWEELILTAVALQQPTEEAMEPGRS